MADTDPRLVGTITGLTKASWGTGSAGTIAALGLVYKATLRRAGEDDKVFSGSGFTIGVIFFDDSDELDVEILSLDAAALPARGGTLAIAASTDADMTAFASGIVFDAEKAWEYKGWKMITVKATKFANLTIAE